MRFYPMPADWLEFASSLMIRSRRHLGNNLARELLESDAGSAARLHLAGYRAGRRHSALAAESGPHAVSARRDSRVHSAAGRRVDGTPARAARSRRLADDAALHAADDAAGAAGARRHPERRAAVAAAGPRAIHARERLAATQARYAGTRRFTRFRQHPRSHDGATGRQRADRGDVCVDLHPHERQCDDDAGRQRGDGAARAVLPAVRLEPHARTRADRGAAPLARQDAATRARHGPDAVAIPARPVARDGRARRVLCDRR
jgi:hypothetical protein